MALAVVGFILSRLSIRGLNRRYNNLRNVPRQAVPQGAGYTASTVPPSSHRKSAAVPQKVENAGSIQSVAVAFDILEALSTAPGPAGVTELARRLGHTKARIHRHLVNLRGLGFVSQDETNDRYQLGWKIYRLGMSVAENF